MVGVGGGSVGRKLLSSGSEEERGGGRYRDGGAARHGQRRCGTGRWLREEGEEATRRSPGRAFGRGPARPGGPREGVRGAGDGLGREEEGGGRAAPGRRIGFIFLGIW